MKTAVITGATGFIGKALVSRLVKENIHVYSFCSPASQDRVPKGDLVTPVPVNLADTKEISALLAEISPDVVYHLAWRGVSTDLKNDMEQQCSNIALSLSVLEACANAGCKHVVIPGSASEYAYCNSEINGENLPAPGDAYAATKAASQIMCRWYAKNNNINLNWLLVGSIYGPGRNDSNVLTYTIKALLRGEETAYSKLEQLWDYIYIDDLLEAMYLVGLHGKPDTLYPVGYGEARPLYEYIRIIQEIIAPDAELGIGKMPYKLGGKPDNAVLDITRLTEDTGFKPKVNFEDGIRKTIEYFKEKELAT